VPPRAASAASKRSIRLLTSKLAQMRPLAGSRASASMSACFLSCSARPAKKSRCTRGAAAPGGEKRSIRPRSLAASSVPSPRSASAE
jgi:hypothetical protein